MLVFLRACLSLCVCLRIWPSYAFWSLEVQETTVNSMQKEQIDILLWLGEKIAMMTKYLFILLLFLCLLNNTSSMRFPLLDTTHF